MKRHRKPIFVLTGPTASGKSAIGILLAQKLGGVILNADAMQCYADLSIITARPDPDEMQNIEHRLYGIWPARTKGNAMLWQEQAIEAIDAVHAAGQLPILVGGTGMYIKSLSEGLSPVPAIADSVREWVRELVAESPTLPWRILSEKDPDAAAKFSPADTQRICRALEVYEQTGRSILDWQREETAAPYDRNQFMYYHVDIPRETMYARIEARFDQMIARGVVDEVAQLKAQFSEEELWRLPQLDYPIMKALGVPEIIAYLDRELSLEEAAMRTKLNSRHYAKRQMTWIRGQMQGSVPIPYDCAVSSKEASSNPMNTLEHS